jgi:hypothetical protein
MKKIYDSWRIFLKEGVEEPFSNFGERLGNIDMVGSPIYHVTKVRADTLKSYNKPKDKDKFYRNEKGEIEYRIYFFKDFNEALGQAFSRSGQIDAIIGGISSGDPQEYDLLIVSVSDMQIPPGIVFYSDPEIPGSSAMYGARRDGKEWKIALKPENIKTATEAFEDSADYDEYLQENIEHKAQSR